MKEIVSSIIIVVIVCAASFLLEKYLDKTSSEIIENLENLKSQIKIARDVGSNASITDASNEILKKWEEADATWSMLIMHEELDMIMLSILEVNAAVETSSFDDALEEIDKTILLVGHIREKEALKIKNIF